MRRPHERCAGLEVAVVVDGVVDLDSALRAYQRRPELRFVYDELPPAEDTRPPAVSAMSEEEGHLLRAELRLRRGQVELANEHLLAARGAPGRARLLGGTMSLLRGHRDEARLAFDAAVAGRRPMGVGRSGTELNREAGRWGVTWARAQGARSASVAV